MGLEVFARTPEFKTDAAVIQTKVDEFLVNICATPPNHATMLADGWNTFRLAFPVALIRACGSRPISQAVDVDQLCHRAWAELGRLWVVEHAGFSPETALRFGLEDAWAAKTAPAPALSEVDDIELDDSYPDEIHDQIFEGSSRERKGRWDELGIKPNAATGDIGPGS